MAVVIQSSLDDKATVAAFDRIGKKAAEVGKTIAHTGTQSAEGLGFVVAQLGRLSPGLNFVGEATVKQLPTLIKYGDALKQFGLVGGAIAATGGALSAIANELGKARKETIQAGSAGDDFLEFLENVGNFRKLDIPFFGRLQVISESDPVGMALGMVRRWASETSIELDKERKQLLKLYELDMAVRAKQDMALGIHKLSRVAAEREITAATVGQLESINDINAAIQEQDDRASKLANSAMNMVDAGEESAKIEERKNALLSKRGEMLKQHREFEKAIAEQKSSAAFTKELESLESEAQVHGKIQSLLAEEWKLEQAKRLTTEERSRIEGQILATRQKMADIDKAGRDALRAIASAGRQQKFDLSMNAMTDPTLDRNADNVAAEMRRNREERARAERELDQLLRSEKKNVEDIEQMRQRIVALRQRETELAKEERDIKLKQLAAERAWASEVEKLHAEQAKKNAKDFADRIRAFGQKPGGVGGGGGFVGMPVAQGGDGAALGGGPGGGFRGQQGWQQWGGPARMPQLQDFRGGQGGGGGDAGAGADGGLADGLVARVLGAVPDAEKLQATARARARRAMKLQLKAIEDEMNKEIAAADKRLKVAKAAEGWNAGGVNEDDGEARRIHQEEVADARRRGRGKRKQKLAEEPGKENAAAAKALGDAADKLVDNAEAQGNMNQETADGIKSLVQAYLDVAAKAQKNADEIKQLRAIVDAGRGNFRARNQQAGRG